MFKKLLQKLEEFQKIKRNFAATYGIGMLLAAPVLFCVPVLWFLVKGIF